MISRLFLAAALALPLATGAQQPNAQQQRMKSCNSEASDKNLKDDERQSFMSHCLKGEGEGRELTAQQEKMKTCNRTASDRKLKGDERRDFMSDCLRADKSAAGATRRAQ